MNAVFLAHDLCTVLFSPSRRTDSFAHELERPVTCDLTALLYGDEWLSPVASLSLSLSLSLPPSFSIAHLLFYALSAHSLVFDHSLTLTRWQTVQWFVDTQARTGLTVCRIKNKFLLPDHDVQDGYRDVSLNVLFTAHNGLKIIGEIQVCLPFRSCIRRAMTYHVPCIRDPGLLSFEDVVEGTHPIANCSRCPES